MIKYSLIILCCLATKLQSQRTYWQTPLDSLAIGHHKHTHAAVTGTVSYVHKETDGDTHIRLVSSSGWFIIGECIPAIIPSPCSISLHVGESITIKGITRRDPEHGWYEIHPIESIVVKP